MAKKNLSQQVQACDLCDFSSKNWYIYKRHRIRCRKEHGITKGKRTDGGASGSKEIPQESNALGASEAAANLDLHESGPELSSTESTSAKESPVGDTADLYLSGKPRPSVNRNYQCTKCGLRTNRSRVYLYHLVESHNSKTDIYACRACEYCSRYRHKIQRHMKITHKLDIPYEEIIPEHENASKRKVSSPAAKAPRKLQATKSSGRRLMVKFSRNQTGGGTTVESPSKGSKSPSKLPGVRSADQLSKVVEEVQGEDGETQFKCRECTFVCDDKQKVAKHMVSWHVDIKHFNCTSCGYICFERNDFLSHRLTHRSEHKFRCDECTYSTDFRPNFERHNNNHRGTFPFTCSFCSYGCGSGAAIRRHMALNHDVVVPKKMKMPVPKSLVSQSSTAAARDTDQMSDEDHQVLAAGSGKAKKAAFRSSSVSPQSSPTKLVLDAATMVPRRTLPPPTAYNPSSSSRELSPVRKLPANITAFVKRENEKLVCPACNDKGYKRCSDLNRHMKRKHGVRLRDYLESIAGPDKVDFDSSLLSDMSTTSNLSGEDMGDDAYEEMVIDDDLNDSAEMVVDASGQSGEEDAVTTPAGQLKCRHCGYEARLPSELRRHLLVHSIEKRYKCSFCPKKYKYLGDMNLHIRKDHGKEPADVKIVKVATIPRKKTSPAIFKCPCCTYTSAWKSEVDRHSRLHTGEKNFQCTKCDYQTYWRGDVTRHVYKHHPELMTEGVNIEDVVTFRKDRTPELASSSKTGSDVTSEDTSSTTSSFQTIPEHRTPESSPSKDPSSREGTPELNMDEKSVRSEHSPSPIKELGGGLYRCQYCGFEANAPSKMNSHIESHTNLKRFMCPTCGRRANWKWDIAKHIKKDHNDEVTQVVKLTKAEAEATIQAYMGANPIVKREHHLNKASVVDGRLSQFFKCSACEVTGEKRVTVSKHIRRAHNGESVNILHVKRKSSVAPVQKTPTKASSKSGTTSGTSTPAEIVTPSKFGPLIEKHGTGFPAKPFMCSECGKRGATKGDVKKHFHYVHPNTEIRIIYTGDSSISSFSAKSEPVQKTKPNVAHSQEILTPIPPPISPSKSPSTSTDSLQIVNPKVLGYIKPFKCDICGRRSNWRWDLRKHIKEKHPGLSASIIEMTENDARTSYEDYQASQLPMLNKTSNSIPRKRLSSVSSEAQAPAVKIPRPPSSGNKGTFRNFKCSACPYRSNWKTDIQRHVGRRHGAARAKVVTLDRREAEATLEMYEYSRGPNISKNISATASFATEQTQQEESAFATEAKTHDNTNVTADIAQGTSASATEETEQSQTNNQTNSTGSTPKKGERKIWKCVMCQFMDFEKIEALKHIAEHNMKAYRCTSCNWTSNFRSAVYKHVRNKHPGDDSAVCRLSIKLVTPPAQEKRTEPVVLTADQVSPSKLLEAGEARDLTLIPVFYCKICSFRSTWRSCVCRHLRSNHNNKEYLKNVVKKMARIGDPALITSKIKSTQKHPIFARRDFTTSPASASSSDTELRKPRPKNFKCPVCPYRAAKSKMIKFHMSCHTPQPGIKQVKCKYCPYYVNKNRLLSQHMALHLQELNTNVVDNTYGYPTTPVKDYYSIPSPVSNKRHKCEKCPYTSNSKNDYLYHKQFHRPKPTADYKCDYCEYWVTHRRLIKQHMKVHQADKGFVPPSPVPPTPTKSEYSENSLVYDTIEIAAIKQRIIASKITASISQTPMISPMKIVSSCMLGGKRGFMRKDGTYRKIHKCRNCPYMNIRLRNMKLHELMHGKRTATHTLMKCPHCDYYVGSKGLLAHHLKVHQPDYGIEFIGNNKEKGDENTSEDSEIDGSTIPVQNKVDTLLEIARFKKFGCEKCPYASSKRVRFQRHVELHGSKQKYKCDYCDYSVPSTNLLTQHQKLHFEPNQNLLAAQSILNLQYLPEMPADVALASMLTNNDSKHPVSVTHDHIDLYENTPEDSEPKKIYRCDRCPYANIRRDHLLAHLRCHMIRNTFSCPYCDYSVSKIHVLLQHVKVHFSPLPELSEWLSENGDPERIKQVKEKDLREAIELAKLFQNEPPNGRVENGTAPASNGGASLNGDQKLEPENGIDKEVETESKIETLKDVKPGKDLVMNKSPIKEDAAVKVENGGMKTEVGKQDEGSSDTVKEKKKEGRLELKSDGTVCNGEDDSNGEEKMEVNTKADAPAGNAAVETTEGYVCQYCDRDFQTSDCLVRHEMQHLIGNSYEELVVQFTSTPQKVEDPVAGTSGVHGNGNGVGKAIGEISEGTMSQTSEDDTDTLKLSGSSEEGEPMQIEATP